MLKPFTFSDVALARNILGRLDGAPFAYLRQQVIDSITIDCLEEEGDGRVLVVGQYAITAYVAGALPPRTPVPAAAAELVARLKGMAIHPSHYAQLEQAIESVRPRQQLAYEVTAANHEPGPRDAPRFEVLGVEVTLLESLLLIAQNELAQFATAIADSLQLVDEAAPAKPTCGVLAGEEEIIGARCRDGGACHHHCTTECARRTTLGCVPLSASGLGDSWEPPAASAPAPRYVMCNECNTWKQLQPGNHHPRCGCGSDNFRWEDERNSHPEGA